MPEKKEIEKKNVLGKTNFLFPFSGVLSAFFFACSVSDIDLFCM